MWAAGFLAQQHVFQAEHLPYRTQLVPLAAIRSVLGHQAETHAADKKLRRWYWSGVLGELYGGAVETRFARDLEQVVPWIREKGPEPITVTEASFQASRLLTLRTRNSAAYKGVYALLMREGCMDWVYRQPMNMASFLDLAVDIHHIFPKAWCQKNGIDHARRESIVNKTALSATTNRKIGGRSPAEYVKAVEAAAGIVGDELDTVLRSHLLHPAALRVADFEAFFADRRARLLELIGQAMGKPIVDTELESATAFVDEADELSDVEVYRRAKQEAGYHATYFLQMVSERGGLATARHLLQTSSVSDGFTTLWERHRLDLTVEAVVLRQQFAPLFTEQELRTARSRLEEYGYRPT